MESPTAQPCFAIAPPSRWASLSAWTWRLSSVAAIVAAILLLGACSLQIESVPEAGASDSAPGPAQGDAAPPSSADSFGRCWNDDIGVVDPAGTWGGQSEGDAGGPWTGGDPVSCDGGHTSYTFAVEEVPADTDPDALGSVSAGETLTVTTRLDNAARDICDEAFRELVPANSPEQRRIKSFWFTPTNEEWEAGARWVRCDVALKAIGTPPNAPELALLPASIHELSDDVASNPRRYHYCVTAPSTSDGEGPLDAVGAVTADCTAGARWEFLGATSLTSVGDTASPTDESLQMAGRQVCTDAGLRSTSRWDDALLYVPSLEDWHAGYQTVSCWAVLT